MSWQSLMRRDIVQWVKSYFYIVFGKMTIPSILKLNGRIKFSMGIDKLGQTHVKRGVFLLFLTEIIEHFFSEVSFFPFLAISQCGQWAKMEYSTAQGVFRLCPYIVKPWLSAYFVDSAWNWRQINNLWKVF